MRILAITSSLTYKTRSADDSHYIFIFIFHKGFRHSVVSTFRKYLKYLKPFLKLFLSYSLVIYLFVKFYIKNIFLRKFNLNFTPSRKYCRGCGLRMSNNVMVIANWRQSKIKIQLSVKLQNLF